MIPRYIKSQFAHQTLVSDQIRKAIEDLFQVGKDLVTRRRVETRLSALNDDWHEFANNHKHLSLEIGELSEDLTSEIQLTPYFSTNLFRITREAFLNSHEQMTTLLDSFPVQTELTTPSRNPGIQLPVTPNHRLPCLDLPKFDGDRSEWLTFRDIFSSLVVTNQSLSPVEKLYYLRTSLRGSAALLLNHTALTGDNFQKAWADLIAYYDNKRVLVDITLDSLFSLKPLQAESAVELEKLYTTVQQSIRSLEMLGQPVQHWDAILIHFTTRCFDVNTVRAWELELGSSTEYPRWSKLSEFIVSRIRSFQALERASSSGVARPTQSESRSRKPPTQSQSQWVHHTVPSKSNSNQCPICESDHLVFRCTEYLSKPVERKFEIIKQKRLCFNCLGTHVAKLCPSVKRCLKCGRKHHTSIHRSLPTHLPSDNSELHAPSPQRDSDVASTSKQVYHLKTTNISSRPSVLLATARAKVELDHGQLIDVRILIDPGSEISLVTEKLVQRYRILREKSYLAIMGTGGQLSGRSKGSVQLKLKSNSDPLFSCIVSAEILPKLTNEVPSNKIYQRSWKHFDGLELADPNFSDPSSVDILLGSDIYHEIIQPGLRKGAIGDPIAQLTSFGWILSGPINQTSSANIVQGFHCSSEKDWYELIERFWQQEEVTTKKLSLSPSEQACENIFESTYARTETGRYIVRLPFKASVTSLNGSKQIATRILNRLSCKFDSDPQYCKDYLRFIRDYEELGHMVRIPPGTPEPNPVNYLPHHGVVSQSGITPKFRGFEDSDDYCFQRILWKDPLDGIITFALKTVTYGLACAPYLALRTLNQLVQDEGPRFPLAVSVLTKGRYVDDIFGGGDSIEEAQELVQQVNQLCTAGGLPLRKWISNCTTTLKTIPTDHQLLSNTLLIDQSTSVSALGLSWQPIDDVFTFSIDTLPTNSYTKRIISSQIARLFDPLGLISPVIIRAKMLLQKLWILGIGWDDPVPETIAHKWRDFTCQLSQLQNLHIPRWIGIHSLYHCQLHGFSDASQAGMAAVVYVRVVSGDHISVSLVCAKTKVTPLKRLTMPRLELAAASLLTKIMSHVSRTLEVLNTPVFMWTDSSIVHTWVNSHPSKWKEYVHNRVCSIQETLPLAKWKLIPGQENPADCASRGLTPGDLSLHELWWNGPPWLAKDDTHWPGINHVTSQEDTLEGRSYVHTNAVHHPNPEPWDLINRYSNLTRLLRVTAMCQRAVNKFLRKFDGTIAVPLTPEELLNAKYYWVRRTQLSFFSREIDTLTAGKELVTQNPLIRLTPFVDGAGLLRVGGRLKNSALTYENKHPLILPRTSSLSNLIVSDAHTRTLHGSTQTTLSYIRTSCWILGGRAPVRSFILRCVKCSKLRRNNAHQLMGQLPLSRVTPTDRPFVHTGLDYAGPFNLKTWSGRAAKSYKAYIVLFVCQTTSAIHLELVTDYTSEAFLAAYRRFISRRGICQTLSSDCGTNLKGADAEMKRLLSKASSELANLATLIANDGTKWLFNPPAAPHFGGKWEAGVKSVKYHLRRTIGDTIVTYEEMATLLTQVEALLNSRPLCPLTDDPDDLSVLTPGHFLIGQSLNILPEPNLEGVKLNRLNRWQRIRNMMENFWNRWSRECLQRYQAVYKWNHSAPSISAGNIGLVIDERYPPAKWPLGRVVQTHPGKDGLVRVATIKTQTNTYTRPIVKLCPLPIPTEND